MRVPKLVIPLVVAALALAACGSDDNNDDATGGGDQNGNGVELAENTGTVNLMSAGEPEETDAYQQIFDDLINSETDYKVEVESVGSFEEQFQIRAEGGTLDVAAAPQPGALAALVQSGSILALEDLGIDVEQLKQTVGESFVELGEVNGKHYGVPTNVNLKSMIWYPKAAFDAKNYTVPKTWDELIALSDKIKQDGGTPWCVGFEAEGATGWPATDWMEDIMLRTAGPEKYEQWVNHDIPFNDPAVKNAAELFGKIMFTEGYVLGGAEASTNVPFGDSPLPMFDDPPKCWLHRQATFINGFFPKDAKAGVDYDWFPFPTIDEDGVLYGGELTVVGKNGNRPEVVDFLNRFVAENVQCEMAKVPASARVSPNVSVGTDCYANSILADASTVLTEALKNDTGRFDGSDQMPAQVGSGSFWTGMVRYIREGPGSLDAVLKQIEDSWPS